MKTTLLLLCLVPLAGLCQSADTTTYVSATDNKGYYPLQYMQVGTSMGLWITGDDVLLYNNKKPNSVYQGMAWYHLPLSRNNFRQQILIGVGSEVATLQADGNQLMNLRDWQLPFANERTSRFVAVNQVGLQLELGYRYYLGKGGSKRFFYPYAEGVVSGRILGLDTKKFATSYTFTTLDGQQSYTYRTDRADATTLVLTAGPRLGVTSNEFIPIDLFVGWMQGLNDRLDDPMPRLRVSYLYFGVAVAVLTQDKQ